MKRRKKKRNKKRARITKKERAKQRAPRDGRTLSPRAHLREEKRDEVVSRRSELFSFSKRARPYRSSSLHPWCCRHLCVLFSFGVFFERRRRKKKDVVDAREASIARRTDARLGVLFGFESRVCIARSFGRVGRSRRERSRRNRRRQKVVSRRRGKGGEGAEGGGKLLRRAVRGRERERCGKHGKRGRV